MNSQKDERTGNWLNRGISTLVDQALVAGAGFVLIVLLARWLAPEQYGGYALAFSIYLFMASFYNSFLLEPMGVFGPSCYKDCLPAYLGKMVRLHLTLTVPLALVLILAGAAMRSLHLSAALAGGLYGAGAAIPCTMFFWLSRQSAYARLRPELAPRGSAAYLLVTVALVFWLRKVGLLSAFTAFLSQAAAGTIAGVILLASLRRSQKQPHSVEMGAILKQHWGYGRWVAATAFVYWLATGGYFFIVGALLKMEDVAALRALSNFALPMAQLTTATALLLLPWASRCIAHDGVIILDQRLKKVACLLAAAGAAYLATLFFLGKPLMEIAYQGRYSGFAFLLPLVVLPAVGLGVAEVFGNGMRAMRAPSEIFWAYTVAGSVTLLVGPAFTYLWGLTGAAASMSTSALAFFAFVAYRYPLTLQKATKGEFMSTQSPSLKQVSLVWLTPLSFKHGPYMQPLLRELAKIFPNTVIFASSWPGCFPIHENTFRVVQVNERRVTMSSNARGYDKTFTIPSPRLLLELLRLHPSVVIVHNFGIPTLWALLAKFLFRSRVIYMCDGMSPAISFMNDPLRLLSRRILARFLDACMTNTKEAAAYLEEELGIPSPKITHHPYQVADASLLDSAEIQGNGLGELPRPRFLYVGQLVQRKGVDRLLEACGIVKQRNVGGFSVLIAGTGAEEQNLHQFAGSLGLDSKVRWLGDVPWSELGAYYRECDVFVLPTFEDTWAVVVLEAMTYGKPVLCSKYAGAREKMIDGETGFVFDSDKPEHLAELIERFILEPELCKKLGVKARQTVTPYTPRAAAKALASVVSNVL